MKMASDMPPKSVSFNCTDHKNDMMDAMYKHWCDGSKYCDVILEIDQHTIKAHKIVLASFSDYFRCLFDMAEEQSTKTELQTADGINKYVLKEVDYESFCPLLIYGYTGQVEITGGNVQGLLICANYYGVEKVKNACEEFMANNINNDNCFNLVKFALGSSFSLPILQKSTLKHIGRNLEYLIKTDEFMSLPVDVALEIYKQEDLVLLRKGILLPAKSQELCLLEGALKFINAVPDDEKENTLLEFLKYIFLPEIDESDAISLINKMESPSIKQVTGKLKAFVEADYSNQCDQDQFPNFRRSPRIFSWQLLRKSRHFFAAGNHLGPPDEKFDDSVKVHVDDCIQKLTLWVRRWDGKPVISGIQVQYKSGKILKHGRRVDDPNIFVAEHVVELEPDEVVLQIEGGHGYLIDRLQFHTNLGRKLGPFGGPGGGTFSSDPGSSDTANLRYKTKYNSPTVQEFLTHGYLHSFAGGENTTQGDVALTHLRFTWMVFEMPTFEYIRN